MNSKHVKLSPDQKAAFERDGYVLMKALLSDEEACDYRGKINKVMGFPPGEKAELAIGHETHTLPDGVTKTSDFWPIIFNKRLVSTVRELLGDDIRYTQHSDLHINLHGGRYHRDSACREYGQGPDWDESKEPYKVVRVAIYLSDYEQSGSSLVVLPGTHRRESLLLRREYTAWNRIRSFLRRKGLNDLLPHLFLTGSKVTIRSKPGDCVIFDQRLLHAGGVLAGKRPKYAVFLSYGADNSHSRHHRDFFLKRPTYSPELPGGLRSELKTSGLLFE